MTPEEFIARWAPSGGAELANSQTFISELCDLLGVPRPEPTKPDERLNDYTYERAVAHTVRGLTSTNRIDCYKRGCFILESKQGAEARGAADPRQEALPGMEAARLRAGTAKRGTPAWDRAMRRAFGQAKGYVGDLPADHAPPPFLIVMDVGHVIELYADFSGQGRNYSQFPDRARHRIALADLAREEVRDALRAVWTDPLSLNPAAKAARVTRDVAERLAKIAAQLEAKHEPGEVATFLMRCVFTMFAEDVGLLPEKGFRDLLGRLKARPAEFVPALGELWAHMDEGRYDGALGQTLRRFNGSLFKDRTAFPLDVDGIQELWVAADKDWRDVEPAIFGTLLERALNPRERAKLGAHYTPRAYVERLVVPTIMEPLREEWENVQARMAELVDKGDAKGALAEARDFHHRLCTTRVLDPACGTGNFLYVALELMKRLEGEVLEAVETLGGSAPLAFKGETVEPSRFFGIELNPRAVPIAELVLWVGYLQWQLRNRQEVAEPVLHAYGTIRHGDAVLTSHRQTPAIGANGEPETRWDGRSMMRHPATGKLVPDKNQTVVVYNHQNPKPPSWPEAEYIIGNPPFIGGKLLRRRLGDGYVEALFRAYPNLPNTIDLVGYWIAQATQLLNSGKIKAFGFVATKTIGQISHRPLLTQLSPPNRIAFAIPNHPWVNDSEAAKVRVAFVVCNRLGHEPVAEEVVAEVRSRDSLPEARTRATPGTIHANLKVGVNVTSAVPLTANRDLSFQGIKLGSGGFIVTPGTAKALERDLVRRYIGGDQLKEFASSSLVIDACHLSESNLREQYPATYQHLVDYVLPDKSVAERESHRDRWWRYGEARPEMRAALSDLKHYLATPESAPHRFYVRLDWPDYLVDGSAIVFALEDYISFAVLHSRVHAQWAIALGGRQGAGNDPRYQNSVVFDTFPFPTLLDEAEFDEHSRALRDVLRERGEALDRLRSDSLGRVPGLTLTGLYNRLERRREAFSGDEPLTEVERIDHAAAFVPLLAEHHDAIDRATLAAYGWDDLIPFLAGRPGGTVPATLSDPAQEAAEEELLSRLVALNAERRGEEAASKVRWLRPSYQAPRMGRRLPAQEHDSLDVTVPATPHRPAWPEEPRAQFGAVRELLQRVNAELDLEQIARSFAGRLTPKRRARVAEVLGVLADLGHLREYSAPVLAQEVVAFPPAPVAKAVPTYEPKSLRPAA